MSEVNRPSKERFYAIAQRLATLSDAIRPQLTRAEHAELWAIINQIADVSFGKIRPVPETNEPQLPFGTSHGDLRYWTGFIDAAKFLEMDGPDPVWRMAESYKASIDLHHQRNAEKAPEAHADLGSVVQLGVNAQSEVEVKAAGFLVDCEQCDASIIMPFTDSTKNSVSIREADGWLIYPKRLCPKCQHGKTEVGRNHDPSGADRSGLRPDLRAQDQQQSEETPRESPLLPGEDIAEALERRGDALSVRAARHIRIKWNTEDGLRQQLRREVERLNASPDSPQKTEACNCGKPVAMPDEHWRHSEGCPSLKAPTVPTMKWDPCSSGGLWICTACDASYCSPPWSQKKAAEHHATDCTGKREPL